MRLNKESIDPRILCNVLAPIFICGFIGNIICIIVFLRPRFRLRSISVYFIALFFNDCLLLFISHVGKMLIFDAQESCWFNSYLTKFINIIKYREMIYKKSLSVLTYNTTYTQIAMLIFMFMSIQRVRTFSSLSYRESKMCALLLTSIAFIYGIIVSYVQLYDGFCIHNLNLNSTEHTDIDNIINQTRYRNENCLIQNQKLMTTTITKRTFLFDELPVNTDDPYETFNLFSKSTTFIPSDLELLINNPYSSFNSRQKRNLFSNTSINSIDNQTCYNEDELHLFRHRSIAHIHLRQYMIINWEDELKNPTDCHLKQFPSELRLSINNRTQINHFKPLKHDYFLEHQFCTQTYQFLELYANCTFPLKPLTFQNSYKFLYDRRFSFNRYTIGFILGTFIPSFICIVSSIICLYYIANRPSIRKHSHSRAELRSIYLILVEITLSLLSALQSYIINFTTCHHILFRKETDNCYGTGDNILPNFLGSILELFTSTSNIIILCICGSQFRHELLTIFTSIKISQKRRHGNTSHSQINYNNHNHSIIDNPSILVQLPHDRTTNSCLIYKKNDINNENNIDLTRCLLKSTTV